jgi:drug/metabolite transporter (DMT)-like permease
MAGVLLAMVPLFVLALSHFLVPGGRLTRWRCLGFGIGFSGVIMIVGPDLARSIDSPAALWGALATLGAALSYAVSAIYAQRIGPGDPVARSAGMLIVASMLSLPTAIVALPDVTLPGLRAATCLLVLGMLVSGFATILYFRLIQGPGPAFLSLVNYMVPAWAVVAGIVFLGEPVSDGMIAGLVLILVGVACSEFGARYGPLVRIKTQRLFCHLLHPNTALGLFVVLVAGCAV